MTGVEAMFKMKYEEMDAKMLATVVCVGRELERRKKAFKKEYLQGIQCSANGDKYAHVF